MEQSLKKLFQFLYGPIFFIIDFFMRHYRANRDLQSKFLNREKISTLFQSLAVIILILWGVTFIFADTEDRDRLTDEIKQNMEALKDLNK